MTWTSAKSIARLLVAAAIAAHLALVALQNMDGAPIWLAELSRFLPFYWLLIPLCVSVALSLLLRPLWILAALANLALFGLVTMDFQWKLLQDNDVAGTRLRVLTYNVKALSAEHRVGGLDDIEQAVAQHAPDIVALQDAQHWLTDSESSNWSVARPVFGLPYVIAFEQYVLASRYPLRDCKNGKLSDGEEPVHYLQCTARIGAQDVHLVTVHFVSPRTGLLAARRELNHGIDDWQANLSQRLRQSQALLAVLSRLPGPLLVMGDLNAPEASPVVENLKRIGLVDAFAEGGTGCGYTEGHALSQHVDLFRIDHILLSAGIAVLSAEVGSSEASEHKPVFADLVIQP